MRSSEVCALALLAMLSAGARAATADSVDAYDLDEIIVIASRRAEAAFEAPYTVNVQDLRELIEVRQVRTIPDAMRELPGVMVQKTGHGQGSPYIRGFTGLRTLFLIDGIRLNNSTFREGPNQYWNTVDPLAVQRLELVKGPASVLYGSDAIGGVVNASSRDYNSLEEMRARGRLVLRGSLAENSMVARPEAGFTSGDLSMFAGVSIKDFGDLHAGGDTGTQPRTGYDERDVDLKLTYDVAPGHKLIAAMQRVNQDDAWRVHKTVFGKNWQGTTNGSELRRSLDQQRTLTYLQYEASELKLSLSYHRQEEQRIRVRSDGRSDRQGVDVGTLGLWSQFSIPVHRGLWTAGLEIYRDDVDSFRRDFDADGSLNRVRIQGPVGDDASYLTTGVFVQNRTTVSERGTLIAGLRYSRARADANVVQNPETGEPMSISDSWSKVTGSLRYSHAVGGASGPEVAAGSRSHNTSSRDIRLFAGISQGFRAPNLSDLTRYDSARSNEIETPVVGLDSERFVTFEFGTKFDNDRWSGQAAYFHTTIDDLIMRTPTGQIIDGDNEVTKRNSGDGAVHGIELQAQVRINENWTVFGNLTWMDGDVETFPDSSPVRVTEPLDRLAPLRAFLGGRWQPASAGHWVEGLLSVAGKQDKLSTRDMQDSDRIPTAGTPGYTVFTIRGGWRVSSDLLLTVAAENLFDEDSRG
jgi:hemoglobin/transferrin/lactoferrin receptor protein